MVVAALSGMLASFGTIQALSPLRAFAAETSDASATLAPAAKAEADQIFDERCAACHGADGRGNGPGAAALHPKPINFHNVNWQRSTTDDQIAKAIVEGGAAVGMSTEMAPNPDLADEPAVVKALVVHVRELGKQK